MGDPQKIGRPQFRRHGISKTYRICCDELSVIELPFIDPTPMSTERAREGGKSLFTSNHSQVELESISGESSSEDHIALPCILTE